MRFSPTVVAVLTTAVLSACAPQTTKPQSSSPTAASRQNSQSYQKVMQAQLAAQKGEWDAAITLYLTAAEETGDAQLAKQALLIAQKQKRYDDAFKASGLWLKATPSDPEALTVHTLTAMNVGNETEAINASLALAKLGESSPEAQHQQLMRLLQLIGYPTQGLFQAIAPDVKYPEAAYLAAAMAAQARKDMAFAHVMTDRAVAKNEHFLRALIFKTELLVNAGNSEEALTLLEESKKRHPGERSLMMTLGRIHYGQGQFREAAQAFKELQNADQSDPEARYFLATSLYMAGDYNAALPLLQQSINDNYQTANTAWLCGAAYERLKDAAQARTCYERVPTGNQFVNARRAIARLLENKGDVDGALTVLQDAYQKQNKERDGIALIQAQAETMLRANRVNDAQAFLDRIDANLKSETTLYLLRLRIDQAGKSDLQRKAIAAFAETAKTDEEKRDRLLAGANSLNVQSFEAEALELLNAAVKQQPADVELRYARALQAETLNKTDLAISDLREVIAQSPNHVDALNALGFTMADHNLHLDEALDLINRAYAQRPASAAIIDSLGWVHYRKGDKKTAAELLRRAYSLDQEPEIAAHYGEVLWHLGEKKKARQVWEEALGLDKDNKHVKERLAKFK